MNRKLWSIARKLGVFVIPLVFVAVTVPTVLAYAYDGTDPHTTGCDLNAFTPASRSAGGGTLELRFSRSCLTGWARFTCWNSGGCTNYTLWIVRSNDGKQEIQHVTWPATTPYGASLYTNQLNDSGSLVSTACYQGYFGAPKYCTASY